MHNTVIMINENVSINIQDIMSKKALNKGIDCRSYCDDITPMSSP